MGDIYHLAFDGNLALALPIALLAGVLAFVSPCVLPLVPGYLAYIGGFTGTGGNGRQGAVTKKRADRRLMLGVALFILGFSVVFIALQVLFATAGAYLTPWQNIISRVAGVLLIAMGLVFIGQFAFLQRSFKPQWRTRTGLAGAPLLGIVFGIGWSPCFSPTLAAVGVLSSQSGSVWRGLILGIVYCLGLGIPFLLVAAGLSWVTGSIAWIKRHVRVINIIGGTLLIMIGLLMVTGVWRILLSEVQAVIGTGVTPF